jgi:hypothetical protein
MGPWVRKESQGGVMRARFAGFEKNAKTSAIGAAIRCVRSRECTRR